MKSSKTLGSDTITTEMSDVGNDDNALLNIRHNILGNVNYVADVLDLISIFGHSVK